MSLFYLNNNCNDLITIFPLPGNLFKLWSNNIQREQAIGMLQAWCMDVNDPWGTPDGCGWLESSTVHPWLAWPKTVICWYCVLAAWQNLHKLRISCLTDSNVIGNLPLKYPPHPNGLLSLNLWELWHHVQLSHGRTKCYWP